MSKGLNYQKTKFACFFAYLAMSSVFVLPAMLFETFHKMYGVSYTLLGSLVLINFCTQLAIDSVFAFFSKHFNIKLTIRIMPLLTSLGLVLYAVLPKIFPEVAFLGLATGTVVFSIAAGLCEVLLSPIISALPSKTPEKDLSMLHSLYGWGVLLNVLIATVFFEIFGTEKWMYLSIFLAILPVIASFLFFISPIPKTDVSHSDNTHSKEGKKLLIFAVCIFLGSAAENTMTNWISGFMENALGLPKAMGDVLGLAVFALLLAGTRSVYAKFTPDISKVLLFSMFGCAVCYITVGVSANIVVSFAACVLVGIFSAMTWPGTLILMEEKIPSAGVAAFAVMAAAGDFGASVAPQLTGIVIDKASASTFAAELSQASNVTTDQLGFKFGMLVASIFPIAGVILLLYINKKKHTD